MTESAPRKVPVAWEALEDAFENNASEVHSYLHTESGDVVRLVDGVADPGVQSRIASDALYLHVDPVSSREQYRWMERFIETVTEPDLRDRLIRSIDGKGAFRRFKDALSGGAVERERWFQFRKERLKACMEAWLETHGIVAVERATWSVPSVDEVKSKAQDAAPERRSRVDVIDDQRSRLRDLAEVVPARDLDAAVAFLEFLRDRRRLAKAQPRGEAEGSGELAMKDDSESDGTRG